MRLYPRLRVANGTLASYRLESLFRWLPLIFGFPREACTDFFPCCRSAALTVCISFTLLLEIRRVFRDAVSVRAGSGVSDAQSACLSRALFFGFLIVVHCVSAVTVLWFLKKQQ